MTVSIEQLPDLRVAAVRHVGPFDALPRAFAELDRLTRQAGLTDAPDAMLVAIYHDDPDTTLPQDLRADAGLVIPAHASVPARLSEQRLPAGRYARMRHKGPYEHLGRVWARFKHEGLREAGLRAAPGPSLEIYRNTPMTAKPEELITDLYIPVA